MSVHTFWELLTSYKIEIPIIQRDYAQGRGSAVTIRNNFLKTIKDHLINNKRLDLDFVYGSVENNCFIPLDGQQRLTTLFLVHWYIAVKEDAIGNCIDTFSKFTYETRISSRTFVQGLVKHGQEFVAKLNSHNANQSLSSYIIDAPWFFLSWKKDPTVAAMLTMLDAIHAKFRDVPKLWKSLTSGDSCRVTFQFIELKNYGLSDNLYIKMNARGKPLTPFELFKAQFEQFLITVDSEEKTTFYHQFSKKIDGVWADFFWKHQENFLYDTPFMRFFEFATEMFFYYGYNNSDELEYDPEIDFSLIKKVYDHSYLEWLFSYFDKLSSLPENFFDSIFNRNNYTEGKVALFSNKTNLLECCLKDEQFNVYEKVLLFSVLEYCVQYDINNVTSDLLDFVRVIRNLLLRVRQQNNITYNSNLRIQNVPGIVHFIMTDLLRGKNIYDNLIKEISGHGFSKDSINQEREKAIAISREAGLKKPIHCLEDHFLVKGTIVNFGILSNADKTGEVVAAFEEIWGIGNDSLVIRALLTIGDFSIGTGGSKLGLKWFFGNDNDWYTVLTHPSSSIKGVLPQFLSTYLQSDGKNPKEKLQTMIDEWLNENEWHGWRYYFVKYPQITSTDNNLFAWIGDTNYSVRLMQGNYLLSYHIDPYIKTVIQIINDWSICEIEHSWGRYDETPGITLKNGDRLIHQEDGWRILTGRSNPLTEDVVTACSITIKNETEFWMSTFETKDRIEAALSFIRNRFASVQVSTSSLVTGS